MKKCCIKWKQPKYIDLDVGNLHYSIPQSNINFCPECSSSLKKELCDKIKLPIKKEIEKLKFPLWLEDKEYAFAKELYILLQDKINKLIDIIQEMKK